MDGFPRNPLPFPAGQQICFFFKASRPDLAPASLPLNGTQSGGSIKLTTDLFLAPMLSKKGGNHYGVVNAVAPVVRDR